MEYEFYGPLFTDFVTKCWQGRIDNPKPSIKNTSFKLMMNSLTGKFGQKSHQTNSSIHTTSYAMNPQRQKMFEELVENVIDFDLIFDEEGDNHAILLETASSNGHPSYPIYLSAQILANSRVHMSTIYRACNAYTDPSCAIFYTDTDSMVMPSKCIPPLLQRNLVGTGIGQLGCDLHDPFLNNQFSKIIRGVWAAPKGPYSLIYINPGEAIAKEKIRTKGIPHPEGPFIYEEEIKLNLSTKDLDKMLRAIQWIDRPDSYEVPTDLIGERFYMFKKKDAANLEDIYFAKHLNFSLIKQMMQHEGELICYYGGMSKEMMTKKNAFLSVAPTVNKRIPCRSDWWAGGNRFFPCQLDPSFPLATEFDLSYPKGFDVNYIPRDMVYQYSCSHCNFYILTLRLHAPGAPPPNCYLCNRVLYLV